jgi:hypothetical protein
VNTCPHVLSIAVAPSRRSPQLWRTATLFRGSAPAQISVDRQRRPPVRGRPPQRWSTAHRTVRAVLPCSRTLCARFRRAPMLEALCGLVSRG